MTIDRHAQLKALQLHGMAAAWKEWQLEFNSRQKPVMPEVWLDRLICAEQADRQARSSGNCSCVALPPASMQS
jgi:hypothetical protein